MPLMRPQFLELKTSNLGSNRVCAERDRKAIACRSQTARPNHE
jgi:hypothetical protein